MDEGDEGALELYAELGTHGDGAEGEPEDSLWGVCDDEEGNSRAESVAFSEHFVQQDDDEACSHELSDYECHGGRFHLGGRSVGAVPDGYGGLAEAEDDG